MTLPLLPNDIKSKFQRVLGIPEERARSSGAVALHPTMTGDRALSMLRVLSPDVSYDDWRNMVWAARAAGLSEVQVREWSARSDKFEERAFQSVWDSFDSSRPDGVSAGTLIYMAREAGWKAASPAKTYRLLSTTNILAMPPMAWRVKGVLPESGVAAIFGPSGSGKSFLAFDLACAIAGGVPWFGHRTTEAPVSIVWLEGEAGIGNRLRAYATHHGRAVPDTVGVVAQSFDITSDDIEALADVLPHDGVVIIDTLNRAAPGRDENSSVDMGLIISGAKALQALVGGLVMFVHHTGKDTSRGLRGHSSLHAALDASIEVSRDKYGRSWSIAKSKDGADGEDHNFRLEVVTLGTDEDGDFITSCVAVPDIERLLMPTEPTGANQKLALQIIRERWPSLFSPERGEEQAPSLSWAEWVELVARPMSLESKEGKPLGMKRAKERAKEAIKGLVGRGYLCLLGDGRYTFKS